MKKKKEQSREEGGHTGVAQWSRGKAFIRLTVGHRVLVHNHTQRHCHEMYIEMLTPPYIIGKHALLECSKGCCIIAHGKMIDEGFKMMNKAILIVKEDKLLAILKKSKLF